MVSIPILHSCRKKSHYVDYSWRQIPSSTWNFYKTIVYCLSLLTPFIGCVTGWWVLCIRSLNLPIVLILLSIKSASLTFWKITQKCSKQRREIYLKFKYVLLWSCKCCLISFLMHNFVFRCFMFCISVCSFDLKCRASQKKKNFMKAKI